jgi:hypothetical protein
VFLRFFFFKKKGGDMYKWSRLEIGGLVMAGVKKNIEFFGFVCFKQQQQQFSCRILISLQMLLIILLNNHWKDIVN